MSESERIVNVNVTFKNTNATEALKQYAAEKLGHALRKFAHHDMDAHVVLRVEKNRQIAEITLHSDGADFNARQESEDLYASIDALVDSMSQQLRKHKEKITTHH